VPDEGFESRCKRYVNGDEQASAAAMIGVVARRPRCVPGRQASRPTEIELAVTSSSRIDSRDEHSARRCSRKMRTDATAPIAARDRKPRPALGAGLKKSYTGPGRESRLGR
jgi:hypothetical protein